MTNEQKFKTSSERRAAYTQYCKRCNDGIVAIMDEFEWLDMKYEEIIDTCPFCGGNDIHVYKGDGGDKYVACCGCGSRTDFQTSDEMAIAAWNRRV